MTIDLTSLQQALKQQAANGSLVINAANLQSENGPTVPDGLDQLMQDALLLPATGLSGFALIVDNVGTTDNFILSNHNQTLTITGGHVNVLNLVAVPVKIIFNNDNGKLQFTLNMTPDDWCFGQSFPTMTGMVEGLIDFTDTYLIFATHSMPKYVFNPADKEDRVDLKPGLNFAVKYDLGDLKLVKDFLTLADAGFTPTVLLAGDITPPDLQSQVQIFPAMDVQAGIAGTHALTFFDFLTFHSPTISIEGNAFSSPNIFLNLEILLKATESTSIASASNGQKLPQTTITVASTADFPKSGTVMIATSPATFVNYTGKTATTFTGCTGGNGTLAAGDTVTALLGLDVKAAVMKHSDLLRVCLIPMNNALTIHQIFTLIPGGQMAWDALPEFLSNCLQEINFFSFYADFSLGNTKTITSVQAAIGSTTKLQLFDLLKIDSFVVNWTCLNPTHSPQNMLSFNAQFNFPFIPSLVFDVTISSHETISGSCTGMVSLSELIAYFNKEAQKEGLETSIAIPFDVSLSDFQLFMNFKKGHENYSFGATANADLEIMGQELLAVTNAQFTIDLTKVPKLGEPTKKINHYTASVTGMLNLFGLDFDISATIGNGDTSTVISIHMLNRTLGELLDMIVKLVNRDSQAILPFPWNKLNDINMDALVLTLTISKEKHEVSVSYTDDINLAFIDITSFTLSYEKLLTGANKGKKSTQISLDCNFFGQSYSSSGGNALAWDPVNGNPPAVPDKGTAVDIRYLGLGQHLSLASSVNTSTMQSILENLENIAVPPPRPLVPGLPTTKAAARPLSNIPALCFDGSSSWFIGADMTIAGAVSFGLVFNDPKLYGLIIALSGPKVKSLAGLQFEILYRKINDRIGEYYLELKLPTVMRHIQMGEVSITLPVIGISIYTNGNFEIDFGFPWHNDFSRAFGLQVFPFVGAGGFYFGVLDGATATQTPAISNGSFDPVIVFGFGLQAGLGKSVNEGVLSAKVEVTVGGILQGVYASFEPNNKAIESATFYKLQGVAAISGVLSGSINFAIIQATVAVHVYADARIVYEVHRPIQLGLDVGVSVEVTVKVLFIHIHFSFHATISENYTIGSATPAPWVLGPTPPAAGQGGQHLPTTAMLLAFPEAEANGEPDFAASRARTVSLSELLKSDSAPSIKWLSSANAYFTTPPQLELDFVPTPIALDPGTGGNNMVDLVAMLYIENSISGQAPFKSAFNLLLEATLAWTLKSGAISGFSELTEANAATMNISYQQLENLHDAIIKGANPKYSDITAFLSQNFSSLNITAFNGTSPPDKSATVFPMIPELSLNAEKMDGGQRNTTLITNFKTQSDVNDTYVNEITIYLQSLNSFPGGSHPVSFPGKASLPAMIFNDYFHLMIRALVQTAKQALSLFSYTITDTSTTPLKTQLNSLGVDCNSAKTPTFIGFAHANKAVPVVEQDSKWPTLSMRGLDVVIQGSGSQKLNSVANTLMGTTTVDAHFVKKLLVCNLFVERVIKKGATLALTAFKYTVPDNSTTTINALFGPHAQVSIVSAPIPGAAPGMYNPYTKLRFQGGSFTTTNDVNTLALVAYQVGSTPALIRGKNMVALQGKGDNTALPDGTILQLPDVTYTVAPDSQYYISRYFGVAESDVTGTFTAGQTVTISNISQVMDATLNLAQLGNYLRISDISTLATTLAAKAIIAPGAVFTSPDFSYTTASDDTPEIIAKRFDVELDALIFNNLEYFYPAGTAVQIPKANVSVEILMETLRGAPDAGHQIIPFNNVAGQVSRFLLHGLRLPTPGQTIINPDKTINTGVTTSSLYSLLGQQFAPGAATSVSLTNPGGDAWLTFTGGKAKSPLNSGEFAKEISSLKSAQTTFTFKFSSYPLYRTAKPRYTLQHPINWAVPHSPAWIDPPTANSITANPSIWVFPEDLKKKLAAQTSMTLSLHCGSRDVTGASSITTTPVKGYRWGTLLNLKIRQIKSTASASGALSYVYEIEGLKSEAERHTLTALIQAYKGDGNKPVVFFIFDNAKGGVCSEALAAAPGGDDEVRVVKSNLSTITGSEGQNADVDAGISSEPLTFLELIWEGSLLHNGGFYLQYQNAQGNGLPVTLFSQGPEANVKLLVLCPADITQVCHYHNAVVLESPVDLSRNVLFAQADELTDYHCVMKPGNLGLKITCDAPTADAQVQLMYNLLTAQVVGNSDFNGSIMAMPAGPVKQPGGSHSTWEFHHLFPIAKMAINKGGTSTPGFPDPAHSPYNAVGATLKMDFYFQDIFGNLATQQKASLPSNYQTIGYFDALISLSRWPGVAGSFDFVQKNSKPQLNVYLHFDVNRYLPVAKRSMGDCIKRARADQALIETIYYQLSGPEVSIALQTSMGTGGELPSATSDAVQLAGQMYKFAATALKLVAPSVTPSGSMATLHDIATTYHVSVEALAIANKGVSKIFGASTIEKPAYHTVKYGDSIERICKAAKLGLKPATWAATLVSLPGILRPGTQLTIPTSPATVYVIQADDTLNAIATKFSTPAVSITAAEVIHKNLTAANIFQDSIPLLLAMTSEPIPPGVASLEAIAKTWKVTPAQLAEVNATTTLAATTSVSIPDAYSLPTLNTPGNYQVHTIATNRCLATIASAQNVLVDDLYVANQGLFNVLDDAAPISLPDYSRVAAYTPDANDTVLTVFSYFKHHIDDLTTDEFISQIQGVDIFKNGAVLLLPPIQVEYNTTVTSGYRAAIFEINASLSLTRTTSSVDPCVPAEVSDVSSVTTSLIPHMSADSTGSVTLKTFAKKFEQAFSDTVKVGVHRQQSKQTAKTKHLWAIPLVESDEAPNSDTLAYFLKKNTATYFAPAPLANQKMQRDKVDIYPYRSGVGKVTTPLQVNFTDIDLDQWARTFLDALHTFTSAEFSVPASDLSNQAFTRLMSAKQSIAGTIASSVIPIMDVQASVDQLKAASESLKERLLQDISVAYNVESIIQLGVNVKNSNYDALNAPRLTGKPEMHSYIVQPADTLEAIASKAFTQKVSVNYLGSVLADVPGLIRSYALTSDAFKTIPSVSSQDSANIFNRLMNNGILQANGLVSSTYTAKSPLGLNVVYQSDEAEIRSLLKSAKTHQDASQLTNGSYFVIPSFEDTLSTLGKTSLHYGDVIKFIKTIKDQSILAHKALNFTWNASPCLPTDTLLTLADRFNVDLYTIVLANLENTGLLQPQTIKLQGKQYKIGAGDTLATLLGKVGITPGDFQSGNHETVNKLVKLAGMFATSQRAGKAGILREQSALDLSTAEIALTKDSAYLTFLLEKTGKGNSSIGENAVIDFSYKVNALNVESGEETLPGFEDYTNLSFVLPFQSTQDLSLDIPIPLREPPQSPTMISQNAVLNTQSTDLETLKQWSYQIEFDQYEQSQDEIEVSFSLNKDDGPTTGTGSQSQSTTDDLFSALANFMSVWPYLEADLNSLPHLCESLPLDPTLQNAMVIAIQCFADYAHDVAKKWSTWTEDKASLSAGDALDSNEYRCLIQEFSDEHENFGVHIKSLNNNLPKNAIPHLDVVDSDGKLWMSSTPEKSQKGSLITFTYLDFKNSTNALTYKHAKQSIKRIVQLQNLNILHTSKVWGAMAMSRNQDLINGQTTNPDFVYVTPWVKFINPCVPFIDSMSPVDISKLKGPAASTTLEDCLSTMFYDLLGLKNAPSSAVFPLTVSCHYQFAVNNSNDSLYASVPVFVHPQHIFTQDDWKTSQSSSFVRQMASTITAWQTNRQQGTPSVDSKYQISVTLLTNEKQPKPFFELSNLYLPRG